MKIEGKEYRTIWFENNIVKIIDQTKLPHKFVIKDLKTVKDAINAIKIMEVRGAPLIGATSAYGLVLAIIENNDLSFLNKSAEKLIGSRPTAINLQWAVHRMNNKISMVDPKNLFDVALNEAKRVLKQDGLIAIGHTFAKKSDKEMISERGYIVGSPNQKISNEKELDLLIYNSGLKKFNSILLNGENKIAYGATK